ncbi:hypothetical protein ASE06_14285 [Sphingopyxis sp. Root214]|nr:hypothetical protein ASD73_11940 [Sphingopyxis sp. Root154]KRC07681.1 hypothetical protein ASE06_14285 [Sphingopyxis sp. Root214]
MLSAMHRTTTLSIGISLLLASPAVAADTAAYLRFPDWQAGGWTVTDDGDDRCDADFANGDRTLLTFMGPYYVTPGAPPSGGILHIGAETGDYALPKGGKYGEFPAELIAGDLRFEVTGSALGLSGGLIADPSDSRTTTDILATLPDKVVLIARVKGRQIYAISLDGNQAAARALRDCTEFITAQKRPGTRYGPRGAPPRPPAPPEAFPERAPEGPLSPDKALPSVGSPNPVPPTDPRA